MHGRSDRTRFVGDVDCRPRMRRRKRKFALGEYSLKDVRAHILSMILASQIALPSALHVPEEVTLMLFAKLKVKKYSSLFTLLLEIL